MASDRGRKAGWMQRLAGLLLIVTALVVNAGSVGWLLTPDKILGDPQQILIINVLRGLCLAVGLVLLLAPGPRLPGFLAAGMLLAAGGAAAFGGFGSAQRASWEPTPLPELCEWLSEGDAQYYGQERMRQLQEAVARAEAQGVSRELLVARSQLASDLLKIGRVEDSIHQLRTGLDEALESEQPVKIVNRMRRRLGIALMRRGEVANCQAAYNEESCLFPLDGGGLWVDASAAHEAIEVFDAFLADDDSDMGVRWLLNVAHMAANNYPAGVPEAYRMPIGILTGEEPAARFRNIAPRLGVDAFNLVGGSIVDDFTGDGLLDIVTSTCDPCTDEPLLFYRNEGDGTFTDLTAEAGDFDDQHAAFNLIQADYDNDGKLDFYVIRGGWMGLWYGRQRNSLLRQVAPGKFEDVSEAAGLMDAWPSLAASWGDFNNDGHVDLYAGNEMIESNLYRNNGDGTFTDIAGPAGVENMGHVKAVSWGDYDRDGDADLFISNYGQPNRLYRNNGDETFTDVAEEAGIARLGSKERTFSGWFFDADNDGILDIFVGGYGGSLKEVAGDYFGNKIQSEPVTLYLGSAEGKFRDVSAEWGLDGIRTPMGANFGDVDNDGYPDIYLGTGRPAFDHLVPNVLYRNLAGAGYVDETVAAGVGHLQKGHGVAFADLDHDGDQDIFAQMGGGYPDDAFSNAFFLNEGEPRNSWIALEIEGRKSNRSAIGVELELDITEGDARRTVYGVVSSGGSFGASSLRQEIGLGQASQVDELRVRWPVTGETQIFRELPAGKFFRIVEGEAAPQELDRPRIDLSKLAEKPAGHAGHSEHGGETDHEGMDHGSMDHGDHSGHGG